MTALAGAADTAEAAGCEPIVLTSRLRGEASEVGKTLVSMGAEAAATGTPIEPPAGLLAGGECTVTIDGEGGSGSPNQELALSAAFEGEGVVLGAVDTDGEDGSSDAAGALVDGSTVGDGDRERARERLAANDAGGYLTESARRSRRDRRERTSTTWLSRSSANGRRDGRSRGGPRPVTGVRSRRCRRHRAGSRR
jgi:hydroxypyruvate reductase